MSNYRALAYHPTSGRLEVATWEDSGFVSRNGITDFWVRFDSDGPQAGSYDPDDIRQPDPVDLFLIAQEMAEALGLAEEAPRADGIVMAADRARAALAKWRDFTNAKEKK